MNTNIIHHRHFNVKLALQVFKASVAFMKPIVNRRKCGWKSLDDLLYLDTYPYLVIFINICHANKNLNNLWYLWYKKATCGICVYDLIVRLNCQFE